MSIVLELHKKLINNEISSKALVEDSINKIKKDQNSNDSINAIIKILEEDALKMADEADKIFNKGDKDKINPLLGIPVVIKDNINIKGVTTTCCSNILDGYNAIYDAGVIKKLKEKGAILIAKSNMDEFAMGSSNEYSVYGNCKNPINKEYTPGGSSGGSAASVAAEFAPLSLGSDTGGSVRQPGAFCGIVGLKPTYGRVSRYGLVAFASSLDQIGPFSRNVKDNAILLNAIAGKDENDSTSVDIEVPDYLKDIDNDIKGLRVGIPKEYFEHELDEVILKSIERTKEILKEKGAILEEVSLPHTKYATSTYHIIASAEASSNLSRYDGIRYGRRVKTDDLIDMYTFTRNEGFGKEVKRRVLLGTFVLSAGYYDAYYLKALKLRRLILNDFIDAFKKVDVLLTPTTPTPAFKLGEKINDPIKMYLADIFTSSANLAGVPAISVPGLNTNDNLPTGVQLISNVFTESRLFNVANILEKNFK